jgi:hypothetical protein
MPDGYTSRVMRSVADDVREEQLREWAAMSPAERMELAFRLGEEGIQFMMAGQRIDRDEAIRRMRRTRRAGRRPSRCHDDE